MKNLSKLTFALLLTLFVGRSAFAQTTGTPDAIIGKFQSADGDRKIEIYKDGDKYFGKLIAVASSEGNSKTGTVILKDLTYSKDKWTGKIYLPARDADYNATLTLPDASTLMIKVKAGMMSKSSDWKRIQQ